MKRGTQCVLNVLIAGIICLNAGCMAQQADVVRIKKALDARISKLDQSKVALKEAVEEANHALAQANAIITQQRAEIQELLVARADVMDEVSTIKDGDLTEVRGSIEQGEHRLKRVTQQVAALGQELSKTRQDLAAQADRLEPVVKQSQSQIAQQRDVVEHQASTMKEFQTALVDFRQALDTLRSGIVQQGTDVANTKSEIAALREAETQNAAAMQANMKEMKRSVESVVSAFEQVSRTLADRLDQQEQKLSQVALRAEHGRVSPALGATAAGSPNGEESLGQLRQAVAGMARQVPPPTAPITRSIRTQPMPQTSVSASGLSHGVQGQDGQVEQVYQLHIAQLRNGELDLARQGFAAFVQRYPRSRFASNAQYWLGECYYGQGQYAQALQAFSRVSTLYPGSHKVPAALLKMGYAHMGMDDPVMARSVFRRLVRTYPKSREAAKAYARLTEISQPKKRAS